MPPVQQHPGVEARQPSVSAGFPGHLPANSAIDFSQPVMCSQPEGFSEAMRSYPPAKRDLQTMSSSSEKYLAASESKKQ